MSRDRTPYIVDTTGMGAEERSVAVRSLIEVVADAADRFECDIPLSRSHAWSDEAKAASVRLCSVSPPRKRESESYRQTGVRRRRDDEEVWRAFTVFAAHAFDATAWDVDRGPLVALSDEGTSICGHLTEAEIAAVHRALPAVELVPLQEWRPRRGWWRPRRSGQRAGSAPQ